MKHGSEHHKDIAMARVILRCEVGSTVHGMAVKDQDDRDEMGICIENPEYVIGLEPFEQYMYRTQPEGVRSGPGDLDLTIYSTRKWMRLALQGNPTILLPLFVPDHALITITPLGTELRVNYDKLVSKRAGEQFLGYLRAQRERMLGLRGGAHVNRPELIEKYGFDTKYAGHMVRLGVQGLELVSSGKISVPLHPYWSNYIRDLRVGLHSQEQAMRLAEEFEHDIEHGLVNSQCPLRPLPDREWANNWLVQAYTTTWLELCDETKIVYAWRDIARAVCWF